jgi:hypothetical protein
MKMKSLDGRTLSSEAIENLRQGRCTVSLPGDNICRNRVHPCLKVGQCEDLALISAGASRRPALDTAMGTQTPVPTIRDGKISGSSNGQRRKDRTRRSRGWGRRDAGGARESIGSEVVAAARDIPLPRAEKGAMAAGKGSGGRRRVGSDGGGEGQWRAAESGKGRPVGRPWQWRAIERGGRRAAVVGSRRGECGARVRGVRADGGGGRG